jgi:transposase
MGAGLSDRRETIPMKNQSQHLIAEVPSRRSRVDMTIGIDLGDVWSNCTLNEEGGSGSSRPLVRELRVSHSDRKSDQVDAEKLARYARLDPNILRPISHRTVEQQGGALP